MVALFTQHSFSATGIRSLCWRGDELVDWLSGGRAFALDGTERCPPVAYMYRFDAATASPDGRFAVIYERRGTKGLLLDDGKILRELNRSFYYAQAYEYPVALFREPGGRLLLAHCPKYDRIELEEAETGRPLTASTERKPDDFFHSRLAASPNGKRLLSAGWLWGNWSQVVYFDVSQALADPHHLDWGDRLPYSGRIGLAEQSSASWLDDERIAVAASSEPEDPEESREVETGPRLLPQGLAVYDVASDPSPDTPCLGAFQFDEPPGTILAIGRQHVLSLFRHPKLVDLSTGRVLHVWSELHSGLQGGPIIWGLDENTKPPPMALDPAGSRFAIASRNAVTVIGFDRSALSSQ